MCRWLSEVPFRSPFRKERLSNALVGKMKSAITALKQARHGDTPSGLYFIAPVADPNALHSALETSLDRPINSDLDAQVLAFVCAAVGDEKTLARVIHESDAALAVQPKSSPELRNPKWNIERYAHNDIMECAVLGYLRGGRIDQALPLIDRLYNEAAANAELGKNKKSIQSEKYSAKADRFRRMYAVVAVRSAQGDTVGAAADADRIIRETGSKQDVEAVKLPLSYAYAKAGEFQKAEAALLISATLVANTPT